MINMDATVDEIIKRATLGLDKTVEFAYNRALKYVPVRAIFKRDRRGTKQVPRALLPADLTTAQTLTAYRRRTFKSAGQFNTFQHARARTQRVFVSGEAGAKARSELGFSQVKGHRNSEVSILTGKRRTFAGNLREWKNGKLVPVQYISKVNGQTDFTGDLLRHTNLLLTARGRYEVRTGRARATNKDTGADQIGGSLKNSIEEQLGVREGNRIIGRISAGNEKVDYARWQEFGSRHNRAQPFLRPALYESREKFKANVKAALGGIERA